MLAAKQAGRADRGLLGRPAAKMLVRGLLLGLVVELAGAFLLPSSLAPQPHQQQHQPQQPPWRPAAASAAGARAWALSAKQGPDHSSEPVIKHSGGGGGSRGAGAGGASDEVALLTEALGGEQNLLEQLLETMGRDSLSERTLDSVLRVYCTHVQPSFAAPWQRLQQVSSTSSGFVIEGRRVITNAHSVEYGSIIQLRKRGDDTKWVAELLAYGPECDLAVLTVKDERFWEGLHPIEFGELPALLDDVSVVSACVRAEPCAYVVSLLACLLACG